MATLTLVGRLKELINRGGEKISPREIDEVLLTHPAVAEAVCFGVPHSTWGEEVAAAVVLREAATESDLLAYCRERLSDYKRPKQIHITDAIPRTATGKIQRRVVAAGVFAETIVRIVIAGAGAIGGYLGARLARVGADVVLFARGPHLRAMQERGLHVKSPDGDFEVRPQVTGDLGAVGTADLVILGVKAHSLTVLAPQLRPLFTSDTVVLSTQNGIPWWYFQGHGGELDGVRLERVDPGGIIAGAIEPRRVVGSLAYFATDILEPGVIRHTEGHRISLGEPDGNRSERIRAIAEALIAAGFRSPVTTRIRPEIWVKLLGNVAFNPISALTGGTLEELARHPEISRLIRTVMLETEAVAVKLGIELPISIDQRMAGAEKVGAHKTSMLQDYEAGRPMELDAVVGGVIELGERLGVSMPATQSVYACAKCWTSIGGHTSWRELKRWRDESGQSLVSARRLVDRDDHDREPAVRLDAFRPAAAGRHGLEALGHPIRVHAVHPVSDLGPAARWMAHRPARPARVHQRRWTAVRPGLGWTGIRHLATDALHAVLRGRCRRCIRVQRIDRVGVEVVQGPPWTGGGHHGGGIRRRHSAVHSVHLVDDRFARLSVRLHRDWPFPGSRDRRGRAVPQASAARAGELQAKPVAARRYRSSAADTSRRSRCCARHSSTSCTRCSC